MKQILLLTIFYFLFCSLYSQKTENDTLPCKRSIKSPWAIKIESGALLHQMFNPDFIDNKVTQTTDLTVFYKNCFFTYGAFNHEFSPKKNMTFGNVNVDNQVQFTSFNLNMAVGYIYDFHKNWSTDIKFGFNSTNFEISNADKVNLIYKSEILMGAQIGVGLNRYIKLKRFNYIVIGCKIDYYTTDYSKASSNLKGSSLNYSLTIGYKVFFKKQID